MLYSQNGDRIVAIDSVTSRQPMYTVPWARGYKRHFDRFSRLARLNDVTAVPIRQTCRPRYVATFVATGRIFSTAWHAADSFVYRDSRCDIQSWARTVHLYCSN